MKSTYFLAATVLIYSGKHSGNFFSFDRVTRKTLTPSLRAEAFPGFSICMACAVTHQHKIMLILLRSNWTMCFHTATNSSCVPTCSKSSSLQDEIWSLMKHGNFCPLSTVSYATVNCHVGIITNSLPCNLQHGLFQ